MSIMQGDPIGIFTNGWFSSATLAGNNNFPTTNATPSPFSIFTQGWWNGDDGSDPSWLYYPDFVYCSEVGLSDGTCPNCQSATCQSATDNGDGLGWIEYGDMPVSYCK